MNKTELIETMRAQTGATPEQLNGFLLLFADSVVKALAAGETVSLADFGSMEVVEHEGEQYVAFEAGEFLKKNLTVN